VSTRKSRVSINNQRNPTIISIQQLRKDKQNYSDFEKFLEISKNDSKLRTYTEIQEFRERVEFYSEDEKTLATRRIITLLQKLDLTELNINMSPEDIPKNINEPFLKNVSSKLHFVLTPLLIEFHLCAETSPVTTTNTKKKPPLVNTLHLLLLHI